MRWFLDLRLKWKFVILVSIALTVVVSLFLTLAPTQMKELGDDALQQKAAVVAAMAASNLSPALVFDDSIQVAEELERAFVSNDIVYAFVDDARGRLRAVRSREGAARATAQAVDSLVSSSADPAMLRINAPIIHQGKVFGFIHIGFSRESTLQILSDARKRTTLTGLIVMIAGIAFVIMVSAVVTRPLNTVKETAFRVHEGEITRRTGLTGKDEVGQVGRAFDIMMDRLADAQERLEAANRTLEQRVAERTRELESEIAERKLSDEKLRASLREKETLLKEIHHRVKNNLQTICSLLNIQAFTISDPSLKDLFSESQARIRSMAAVHEKLYQSDNLAKIDFADYLQSMAHDLSRAILMEGVSVEVKAERIYLAIDTAIPCGLLANELISNAMKHAFPNGMGGHITVHLRRHQEELIELIVEDNGKGFPVDADFREMTSMGMTLVVALTEQLGGTIEFRRTPGTQFRFTFTCPGSQDGSAA